MSTPLSTPVRQAKLGIASTKSLPLANEFKKLLNEQYQRLYIKHQQDLDLIDDIRSYVKARLSIEKEYTSAQSKLARQHLSHIAKKFTLLAQCDPSGRHETGNKLSADNPLSDPQLLHESEASDSRLQKRLANNGLDEPEEPCSLYKVWSEHINRLQATSKNRADQFEQLIMVADKLKDIRSHKASIGKKCLDKHLKRIHEDILVSMVEVEKSRKLYYEDESQARKARENEEKIKKKRSGLLTKFTDLQAQKEKTSAQREANDIQSTQARNDYIMALAAGNAHLNHYYQRDLTDFIHIIDDGVLDHCKIFMATLSECDINSLKDALTAAQYWSKMIHLTGSQKTNSIFFECEQSICLRQRSSLKFEPCNDDPIQSISLEHNADYALQHEIDKWFTWFKKECRNLSQLIHQLEMCQRAFSEGKKSIELNGQATEDIESKIVELKQQIRKSEAAKLKAQARLAVIKEGGMQIEEWGAIESEIRADMARAQEEQRAKETVHEELNKMDSSEQSGKNAYMFDAQVDSVQLQVSKDSDDSEAGDSIHHMASVSRSTSNLKQKQQNAGPGYTALTDPSLVWQDDFSNAWSSSQPVVVTDAFSAADSGAPERKPEESSSNRYDLLGTTNAHNSSNQQVNSMTVQSSSPLSAIVDGGAQSSPSQYPGMMSEAYKSDFECDYNRSGAIRSTASSADNQFSRLNHNQVDPIGESIDTSEPHNNTDKTPDVARMLNKRVIALYAFDKSNEDDLAFNENDILLVVEADDANWVKARNEATGQMGYIPTSYVRLLEDESDGTTFRSEKIENEDVSTMYARNSAVNTPERDSYWNHIEASQTQYCRAVYDYEPEADTYEDDGLPHLALVQGELMKIIEQGEDDGWWLVEKENNQIRGHVPSMLVEEVNPEAGVDEDEYDDSEDLEDEQDEYVAGIMPNFEPPQLDPPVPGEKLTDLNNNDLIKDQAPKSSGLVPTSFIIIEPTPEVESRRFEDSFLSSGEVCPESCADSQNFGPKIVHGNESEPPAEGSYSIINEDFVLKGPTRKPYHREEQVQHHETPTILEESEYQNNELYPKSPDGNYEPLSEVDSLDTPAPPSVVIESFEDDEKHSKSLSSGGCNDADNDDDREDRSSLTDYDSSYIHKEIKHTGNVDVNPMIRHRAEEFSKQIIAEALMLAPGADVGPSTSSATFI